MESTKDQRIFYEKVQKLLEDLKTAIEEPMTLDPKILPELGNLVKDLSKMMDGNAGMQHHYLGTIQSLVKQVESLNWEMSGKSVDRRAIPAWDKSSTSKIMKESAREVMAGIRWSLQEMGHMLREQGLVQDKQLTVLSDLAASAQRTAEVLEMINEREAKHQDAMEKKKAEKAVEEQKKRARLRAQKEQAEKDRIAQEDEVQKLAGESARKRKMEELESANKALEEAQKKAKALESELNQGTPVKNMPARPRMIQTPTVPVPEPLYPPTPAVPESVYPPGYLPPQMQMVPPAGWAPMTPGSEMGYGMPFLLRAPFGQYGPVAASDGIRNANWTYDGSPGTCDVPSTHGGTNGTSPGTGSSIEKRGTVRGKVFQLDNVVQCILAASTRHSDRHHEKYGSVLCSMRDV